MLDLLARLVTERRGWVLGALLLGAAALASQIPKIEADPAAENLIASFEGLDHSVGERFRESFGDTSRVMVVLVEADDVLAVPPLQYLHDVAGHLGGQSWVERAETLTTMNLPRREEKEREVLNLDQLLEDEDGGDDDLGGDEDLDDLGGDEDLSADADEDDDDYGFDPDVVDSLVTIIESDPDRFPGGLSRLGPTLSNELQYDAAVEGDTVTEEDAAQIRNALRYTRLLNGRMISEDRRVAVVAVFLADVSHKEMRRHMVELNAHLVATPPPSGAKVHIGGLPYLRSSIVDKMRSDQLVLIPLTLVVCVLLLILTFRWLPAVALPIGAVALTALMVVGGMAVFGEPMNVLNNIIPALLIIIGISDSIHLIGRYREEFADHGDRERANDQTVRSMAVACLLTSVTTGVGLASLVVSKTAMLRHFGITAAIGVMVAYVVTITFLPSVLTWTKPPRVTASDGVLEALITGLTKRVLAARWLVLAGTVVLLAGSVFLASKIRVDHALLDQFDEQDPVFLTTRMMEEQLEGVRPLELVFETDDARLDDPAALTAMDNIARWAKARQEVLGALGPADLMRQALFLLSDDEDVLTEPLRSAEQVAAITTMLGQRDDGPLEKWVTADGRRARLQLRIKDVGARATMALVEELEGVIASETRELPVRVAMTGEAFDGSLGQQAVVSDLMSSLLTAVAIIFVLLTILFGSVRLGILSIPPNLIPLVGTMAYMTLRGIPLNAATVIIFSISLGLAVDGTIHVLARFREESAHLDREAALLQAARGTGRAIVVSCVTLMAGFAVLLLSSFVPVRRFGELIAVTVAGCLLATLVVQPALLAVAGVGRSPKAKDKEPSAATTGDPA